MKDNKGNIFIFIASIIIGLLIAIDIGFEGYNSFFDIKQYVVAYKDRSKLYSELNILDYKYANAFSKLQAFENGNDNKNDLIKKVQKQITFNNLILGRNDVEGQGVKIKLEDGTNDIDVYPSTGRLIHDYDIVQIINDLWNAGSEAISVNGQRIVYDNYGLCDGATINLNGIKIVPPFYISAIGNQGLLYNYLTLEQTHVELLKLNESKINIIKMDNIKILAYTGDFKYNYIGLRYKIH